MPGHECKGKAQSCNFCGNGNFLPIRPVNAIFGVPFQFSHSLYSWGSQNTNGDGAQA